MIGCGRLPVSGRGASCSVADDRWSGTVIFLRRSSIRYRYIPWRGWRVACDGSKWLWLSSWPDQLNQLVLDVGNGIFLQMLQWLCDSSAVVVVCTFLVIFDNCDMLYVASGDLAWDDDFCCLISCTSDQPDLLINLFGTSYRRDLVDSANSAAAFYISAAFAAVHVVTMIDATTSWRFWYSNGVACDGMAVLVFVQCSSVSSIR